MMHPADRPAATVDSVMKKIRGDLEAPVQRAIAQASNVQQRAIDLERRVEEVTAKLEETSRAVVARSRMTPQDLRDALMELFKTYDFSPAEDMVRMLKDSSYEHYVQNIHLRVKILSELQSYVMPKLKNTEVQGKVEHSHKITIMRIGDDGVPLQEKNRAEPIEVEARRG
jgi:uncharacterized protein YeeX (DUF496 family)